MSPPKARSLIVVLVAAAIAPRGAFAQGGSSPVTCISSFDWMNNSLSQNPCLVGSYLVSECLNGTLIIDPFPSGPYTGPSLDTANNCLCSTVTYSLLGACGICQNNTAESWSVWSTYCSESLKHLSVFPMNIPNGTAVPHWAYLDVVTDDTFNATAAQLAGDSPEATSTQVQSTGTSSIISSTTSVSAHLTTTSTTATESSTAQSTSKSSNVGAIAGGVVGGITIVGVAAWFFVRRSRSTTAKRSAALRDGAGLESAHMTQQFRLYDPSDPNTFPISLPSGVILSTSSSIGNAYQRPSIPSHVYSEQSRFSGKYSGAPEL